MSIFNAIAGILEAVFGSTEKYLDNAIKAAEEAVHKNASWLKKQLFRSTFELFFYLVGAACIISGMILLFSRYFSFEAVFIVAGLLCLYIGLMIRVIR